jgi:hypothetical protein
MSEVRRGYKQTEVGVIPDLNKRVAELEAKVGKHLAKMGFEA